MNFKLITLIVMIGIVFSNMNVQISDNNQELTRDSIETMCSTVTTTTELTQNKTSSVKPLNSSQRMQQIFVQYPRKKKRFRKNLFGKKPLDMNLINTAIDVLMPTIPRTIKEFKSIPLKTIQSDELKKRLITIFFSRLYGLSRITAIKDGPQLGFDIETIIFSFIAFEGILNPNYRLRL